MKTKAERAQAWRARRKGRRVDELARDYGLTPGRTKLMLMRGRDEARRDVVTDPAPVRPAPVVRAPWELLMPVEPVAGRWARFRAWVGL